MSSAIGFGERRDRPMAAVATVLLHAALLFVILTARQTIAAAPPEDAIDVFDVTPPPPVVPAPVVQPPRPRPTIVSRDPGGSRTTAATVVTRVEAPAPPPVMDVTTRPDAPPVPVAPDHSGGSTNTGPVATGNGSGSGSGSGNGTGSGSGEALRFGRAEWIVQPTLDEINRFWPQDAKRKRVAGLVLLACRLRKPGKPDQCWALSEQPSGFNFASAAVRMSRVFRIRPVTRNGETFDLPVRIPIAFTVVPEPAPAPRTTPTPP